LGNTRLSIIDRAGGAQPLFNEDRSKVIVFNGEVYNHGTLRPELQNAGHVFRSRSDTETVLHAFEEWGVLALDRLEGMFAFAIYDLKSGELFIARDRLGKKPLYFGVLGNALHFASEIKSLRASPVWTGEIDATTLEEFFLLGYVLAPRSIYRGIHKLRPGHWLKLRNGKLHEGQYWDVEDFDSDTRSEETLLGELESALSHHVEERLESEVPLGIFLSGGIDSGLVVSYAEQLLPEKPTTISVGFSDPQHDELAAAQRVATRFGTRHHALTLEPRVDQVLDSVVDAFDEPFADASAIPTYFVCQAAKQSVTVCLSGDGGDEVFGGYDFRYQPHAIEEEIRKLLPAESARAFVRWLGKRWPRSQRIPRLLRWGTILDNIGAGAEVAYFADLCFLKPEDAGRLLGRSANEDIRNTRVFDEVTAPYSACPSPSVLQRAQYADLKVYLPNDVLVKVDRMSMAHSLEVRSPLLDRRLVEFAFRIPTSRKMPRLKAKHLLRSLAVKRLPPENIRLPKHGFTAPTGSWITKTFAHRFQEEVLSGTGPIADFVDVAVLRQWFEQHRRGIADRSFALWASWVFSRWAHRSRDSMAAPAGRA
jgi:asparagine synthase (glutamine-hydrolysing)